MSDLNLTDAFTNVIKKNKFFEKLDKIQFYVGSFVLFSSIIGITSLFIHHSNINIIYENRQIINKNKNEIMKNMEVKHSEILSVMNNMLYNYENKLVALLENQQKSLDEIKNSPLVNIGRKENISRNVSISSLTDSLINNNNEHENEVHVEDNELINECYDIIPLNNNKKITGINWLF